MGRTALLTAAAIIILGVALVMFLRPTPYFPVARVAAPEGVALSFLQDQTATEADCQAANQRVTATMLANCKECSLAEARCVDDAPKELGQTAAGPQDMIAAKGLKILITAPPVAAHALCRSLAAGIATNDATAKCLQAAD
ncbi:MAG: hypothetical protein JWO51_1492 [Rhodospirillales bacterium]|nr:hypothetical protein [Rhodospirillales bacterium]